MCDNNTETNAKQPQQQQQKTEEMGRMQSTEANNLEVKDPINDTNRKLEQYMALRDIQLPMEMGKKVDLDYKPVASSHLELKKQFSSIFMERLRQIDRDKCGDTNLKLVTYQEWVEMLLQLNESIIQNLSILENEVTERLTLLQRHTSNTTNTCRLSQGNELAKARKDLATLTQIIQNAYYQNQWGELQQHHFETLTLAEVFGAAALDAATLKPKGNKNGDAAETPPPSDMDFTQQHNKLLLNVKALAFEVANKHDEVRGLQKQIVTLEDEMQKAFLKIQLKDDVIKELRNELKTMTQKLSEYTNKEMHDMESMTESNAESAADLTTGESNESGDSSDNASTGTSNTAILLSNNNNDDLMCQLKELASKTHLQNGRSVDICQRAEHEKREAYRKLDYLRSQLVDIETVSYSADSGMCDENDTDGRIIESIRRRIFNLKECSQELNKQVQQFSIENSQLSANLAQEKCLFQRICGTMKEVADLLVSMTGHELDFNHLFDSQPTKNPFLEPILAMKTMAHTREDELLDKLNERNNMITTLQDEVMALKKNGKSDLLELRAKERPSSTSHKIKSTGTTGKITTSATSPRIKKSTTPTTTTKTRTPPKSSSHT